MRPPPLPSHVPSRNPRALRHIFSVDLEEYFQVNAFERVVPRDQWSEYPSRVERSTDLLLALLADHGATATFFCLGWIAERHPHLIRRISDGGHEIASHGWWHQRVTEQTRDEFEREARTSKQLLEDLAGREVLGYRAPSFSIVPGREWALDVLLEQGYRYDSSLFPIHRRGYGYPHTLSIPHTWSRPAGTLLELPPATFTAFGVRIPAAGGGYLRQLPLGLIRAAIHQQAAHGYPAMVYIHPWELDPGQPRLRVGAVTRVRHYRGLAHTGERLAHLLREFTFASAASYVTAHRSTVGASPVESLPSPTRGTGIMR